MERILVGFDTTETSDFVLDQAVELARLLGARIRLVRAVSVRPSIPPPGALGVPYSTMAANMLESARSDVLRAMERVPASMRDGVVVDVGGAADVLCREAKSYDADLIVIGAHAHGAIARALGTTAARVTNRADRQVMVVRPLAPVQKKEQEIADERTPGVRRPDEHTMLEASTLTGAAFGAAAGAFAGPPGAIVGGALGTMAGMLAGIALDDESARQSAHDRELDDAIGVTSGDLGAKEKAARGLTELEHGAGSNNALAPTAALLRDEHERLDRVLDALRVAYGAGDWTDVHAQWDAFEQALLAHMNIEEERVFPAFEEVNPAEAAALRAEHDQLRHLMDVLGIAIDLHAVPSDDIDALVKGIQAHASREASLLYPWMEASHVSSAA